jgi:RNA polymerase sigma-70 factor, ECF subfamily
MDHEERFDDLWRDHAQAVLRYTRRRVMPADVDDVVAETFVVAWRRLDEVPEQALPWLLGVARGVSANALRSARRRDALADRVAATGEHDPRRTAPGTAGAADTDIDTDTDGAAVAALRGMSDLDRELLTLIAWDGLSHAEAATALGCSPGALKVRLHRARKRFASLLGPSPPPPRPIALVPRTDAPTGGAR